MKWLIFVMILSIVLIAGCTQIQSISTPTQTNFSCPYENEIKKLIQESFQEGFERDPTITEYGTDIKWNIPNTTLFLDKTEANYLHAGFCNYGSQKGQNVNYLYCDVKQLNYEYKIQQTIVSPNGIVQEIINHKILMPIIIDPTTNFTVIDLKCQKVS